MATNERYTTHDRVNRLLRLPSAFTSSTVPTIEQVEALININMDNIDQDLRTSFHLSTYRERLDIPQEYLFQSGARGFLTHRNILIPLATASGDSLKVFDGSNDIEWVGVFTENRNSDFWIEEILGILYLRTGFVYPRHLAVDITYRYNSGGRTLLDDATGIDDVDTTITVDSTASFPKQGWFRINDEEVRYNDKTSTTFTAVERGAFNTTAASHNDNDIIYHNPDDITDACTKLVAIDLLTTEDWSSEGLITGDMPSGQLSISQKIENWRKDVEKILDRRMPTLMALR